MPSGGSCCKAFNSNKRRLCLHDFFNSSPQYDFGFNISLYEFYYKFNDIIDNVSLPDCECFSNSKNNLLN